METANGIELVTHPGPGFPRASTPLNMPLSDMNNVLACSNGRIYTYYDYQQLYTDYMKRGNPPLKGGFTYDNLETVVSVTSDDTE